MMDVDKALGRLYKAVEAQDQIQVETILRSAGSSLKLNQCPLSSQMTVLHLAVGNNSAEIVDLLLKYGSDPNSLNCEEKLSPLHLSVLYDYGNIVRLLVEAGGDPLIRDGEGKSCLDFVVENELYHLLSQLILERDNSSLLSILSQVPAQQRQHVEQTSLESFFSCLSGSGSTGSGRVPVGITNNQNPHPLNSDSDTPSLASNSTASSDSDEKGINIFLILNMN